MSNAPFDSLSAFRARLGTLPGPDAGALKAASARNGMLTKPPGALTPACRPETPLSTSMRSLFSSAIGA